MQQDIHFSYSSLLGTLRLQNTGLLNMCGYSVFCIKMRKEMEQEYSAPGCCQSSDGKVHTVSCTPALEVSSGHGNLREPFKGALHGNKDQDINWYIHVPKHLCKLFFSQNFHYFCHNRSRCWIAFLFPLCEKLIKKERERETECAFKIFQQTTLHIDEIRLYLLPVQYPSSSIKYQWNCQLHCTQVRRRW